MRNSIRGTRYRTCNIYMPNGNEKIKKEFVLDNIFPVSNVYDCSLPKFNSLKHSLLVFAKNLHLKKDRFCEFFNTFSKIVFQF